jgi:hypothetical protein
MSTVLDMDGRDDHGFLDISASIKPGQQRIDLVGPREVVAPLPAFIVDCLGVFL